MLHTYLPPIFPRSGKTTAQHPRLQYIVILTHRLLCLKNIDIFASILSILDTHFTKLNYLITAFIYLISTNPQLPYEEELFCVDIWTSAARTAAAEPP
jgi:hypothetical protein